jgi:hypothetical protein
MGERFLQAPEGVRLLFNIDHSYRFLPDNRLKDGVFVTQGVGAIPGAANAAVQGSLWASAPTDMGAAIETSASLRHIFCR